MSPSTSTLFSILFIAFSISLIGSHSAHVKKPPQKLYEIACNDDAHCLKVLGLDTKIVAAKDWITECRLILTMAAEHANKTGKYFQELIRKYPNSEAIKLCANQHYKDAVNCFISSMDLLTVEANDANYMATRAGDGPNYCEKDLDREKLVIPEVNRLNYETIFFSNIAADSTSFL